MFLAEKKKDSLRTADINADFTVVRETNVTWAVLKPNTLSAFSFTTERHVVGSRLQYYA